MTAAPVTLAATLVWISEAERLPRIGQHVLVAIPRQMGDFWDLSVRCILARHEDVIPRPVCAGDEWPVDYYWGLPTARGENCLVTGNGYWASLESIPLPLGAAHDAERGFTFVRQIGDVFVPMRRTGARPVTT